MMKLLAVIALALSLWAYPLAAKADCSGSGLAFTCDNTSTAAQISSAISSASDTAVVTLEAGTYTLTGLIDLTPRNGITVICETVQACTLSRANDIFYLNPINTTITALTRISGFILTGAVGTAKIWLFGQNNIEKLRIDHNKFDMAAGSIAILIGGAGADGVAYGVIDHNLFISTTGNFAALSNIGGNGVAWPTGLLGLMRGRRRYWPEEQPSTPSTAAILCTARFRGAPLY